MLKGPSCTSQRLYNSLVVPLVSEKSAGKRVCAIGTCLACFFPHTAWHVANHTNLARLVVTTYLRPFQLSRSSK